MGRRRKLSFTLATEPSGTAHTLGVNCCVPMPDGRTVLTAGRDGQVLTWNLPGTTSTGATASLTPLRSPHHHADWVNDLVALPGGGGPYLSASSDHTVALCTTEGARAQCRLHTGAVTKLALFPGPRSLMCASVGADGHCLFLDTAKDLACTGSVQCHSPLYAVVASPSGDGSVYCGGADGTLSQVDSRARSVAADVDKAHGDALRDLAFRGNHTLISAGSDGLVKTWDVRSLASPHATFAVHTDAVRSLAVMPSTYVVLSAARDGAVVATNIRSHQASVLIQSSFPPLHVSVSGHTLLVANTSPTVEAFSVSQLMSDELRVARHARAGSSASPGAGTVGATSSTASGTTPRRPTMSDELTPRDATAGAGPRTGSFTASPSAIVVEARDAAPAEDLVEVDEQVFELPAHRLPTPPALPDAAAKQLWCSARDAPWRHPTRPEPEHRLYGRPGVTAVELLHTKRHVLSLSSDLAVDLWDLLACRHLQRLPHGTEFAKAVDAFNQGHVAHIPTWCSASCAWGEVCVTLTAEGFAGAVVSEWENSCLERVVDAGAAASSSLSAMGGSPGAAGPPPLSIYTLSRSERVDLRTAGLVNFGAVLLKRLFVGAAPELSSVTPPGSLSGGAIANHSSGAALSRASIPLPLREPFAPAACPGETAPLV